MSACNYLETKLMESAFGKIAFTAATPLYIGLCTGVSEAGAVTGEPSGNGYTRVSVTNNQTTFPACGGTPGVISNGIAFQFPTCITVRWGTLTKWFISDAASGDTNTYAYGDLSVARTVELGDAPLFAIGALTMTLD